MPDDSVGGHEHAIAAIGDEAIMDRFGYRPQLKRTLGMFSLFAIAFSAISITTSIFLNYGFGLAQYGPASLWVWPIVGVGQIVLALVIAEIGTRMPLAGYSYQWTARLMSSGYAWFVAAAALLYLTVGLAAVAYEVNAPLVLSEFNDNDPSKTAVLILALVLVGLPSLINIVGVRLVAKFNNAGVFSELVGTTVFAVVLIVLFISGTKHVHHGAGILFNSHRVTHNPVWYSLVLSGLVGAFTLVGWESAADLGEEVIGASKRVPRAMLSGLIGSVILGMLALVGFTLAIPNLTTTEASTQPILTIGGFWLGSGVLKFFVSFVIVAIFALNVAGAAGQSRLLFSLARDNMVPGSKWLARINERSQTPVPALIVLGILIMAAVVYGRAQPNSFGTLVGATALLPFIIYALVLIAYLLRFERLRSLPGSFDLGRWGRPVAFISLLWTLGVCAALSFPAEFHGGDKVVLWGAVVSAVWYVLVLFRRIRSGAAGVPVIEALTEEEATAQHVHR